MKRRTVLKSLGIGMVGVGIAKPAIAQSHPEIRWRMTSAFPKSLDTMYGAGELFAKIVSEMTDKKFQIQVFAPGEIVGTFQALDAVTDNTVEMAHTSSYYYIGKDPTFAFGTGIPFGPNSRQTTAWMLRGGGLELLNEFYAKHNVHALLGGNTGTQMGGWFRKEIKSVDDLKGLKFRLGGFGGQVLARLGVVPQAISGGDIYPALERGTIDAAEFSGPYDDEKLGFHKIAPYYYYPGWWEGGAQLMFFFNRERWNGLPKAYQEILAAASIHAHTAMQAEYDARNPAALRRLVGLGAQLRPFSPEILEASHRAAQDLYAEVAGTNAEFKRIYEPYRTFQNEEYLWFQVAEYTYDNFMIRARARGGI